MVPDPGGSLRHRAEPIPSSLLDQDHLPYSPLHGLPSSLVLCHHQPCEVGHPRVLYFPVGIVMTIRGAGKAFFSTS